MSTAFIPAPLFLWSALHQMELPAEDPSGWWRIVGQTLHQEVNLKQRNV